MGDGVGDGISVVGEGNSGVREGISGVEEGGSGVREGISVGMVVGISVEVAGRVLIGTLGTFRICPALILLVSKQLACCNFCTLTRKSRLML